MREMRLKDPNGNGYFSITEIEDFENAHPLEKLGEMVITNTINLSMNKLLFAQENNELPSSEGVRNSLIVLERIARKVALSDWNQEMARINAEVLPENIMNLLTADSKKQQLKLLKDVTLTTNQLMAFIVRSWDYGYTYSTYRVEQAPHSFDKEKLPLFAYKEDNNEITTIWKTTLTTGQIKQLMEQRNVRVIKFLDHGDKWLCFFSTYRSLFGQETYKGGDHIHFISSMWGLSRDHVLSELRKPHYALRPSHVPFRTHRNSV